MNLNVIVANDAKQTMGFESDAQVEIARRRREVRAPFPVLAKLGERRHIEQHHVFDFAGKDTRPNGCANGNDFIGIDRLV